MEDKVVEKQGRMLGTRVSTLCRWPISHFTLMVANPADICGEGNDTVIPD